MSIVLIILVVFAFSIAFIARNVGHKADQGSSPGNIAVIEERFECDAGTRWAT